MKTNEKRKEAIKCYLSGESITEITRKLKQSRMWFYKWYKRYQADPEGLWYEEHSRRPKTIKKKLVRRKKQEL